MKPESPESHDLTTVQIGANRSSNKNANRSNGVSNSKDMDGSDGIDTKSKSMTAESNLSRETGLETAELTTTAGGVPLAMVLIEENEPLSPINCTNEDIHNENDVSTIKLKNSNDDQSDDTHPCSNTTSTTAVAVVGKSSLTNQQQQQSAYQQYPKYNSIPEPKQKIRQQKQKRQQMYPPERVRKDRFLIVNHEELVPLTDHSDPSHVPSRQYSKRKKQPVKATIPINGSNVSSGTNDHQMHYNYQNPSNNTDYNAYLVESNTENTNLCRRNNDECDNVNNSKKKQACISGVSIILSTLTVVLCCGTLLICFAYGVFSNNTNNNTDLSSNDRLVNNGIYSNESNKVKNNSFDPSTFMKEFDQTHYDEMGRYKLVDYDTQSPFSDFLPGLAGFYGKPLYAFYVNRGQGIASFGVESKDYPIQEYHSANIAYQNTPFIGFRTFIQGKRMPIQVDVKTRKSRTRNNDDNNRIIQQFLIEPFGASTSRFVPNKSRSDSNTQDSNEFREQFTSSSFSDEGIVENLPKRNMYVGANDMKIQEIDNVHHVETNVSYFTLPEEDFGAFVRRVSITNTDLDTTLTLSVIDGLAQIQPAGGKMNAFLKSMGRTLEGFMDVYQVYNDTIQMPYYRLSTQPTDDAAVTVQQAGHWCLSVLERDDNGMQSTPNHLLPIIFDPDVVFGPDTSLLRPINLYTNSIRSILHDKMQYGEAKTPSAFSVVENFTLQPGQKLTFTTYYGKAEHILDVPVIARRLLQQGFSPYKMARAREIASQITVSVETHTSNKLFNGHIQQVFLDNSLRGGMPFILGEVDDNAKMRTTDEDPRLKVCHLFSRIHGDLERDYNEFVIKPTFFSEGPANFRDVVQNRRNDIMFVPRIGAFNVKMFLSFIQADGYEPLTVEAVAFTIKNKDECVRVATRAVGEADGHRAQRESLAEILNAGPFRPGQLFELMQEQHIELMISRQDFVDMVAATADYLPYAEYTTGFWADHWTYYVDLIESYLSIYPDWEKRIMFDESLPYFFSPAFVNPRSKKYVLSLSFDGRGKHVRQLNATNQIDDDKMEEIRRIQNATGWFESECNWKHDEAGQIFKSSPMAKLFLLATLKFATRDSYGMGIEYEGGRPGWNDANNGLVGMLGSGMPETFELVSLLRYIHSALRKHHQGIVVPEELYELVSVIQDSLAVLSVQYSDTEVLYPLVPPGLFRYWDSVSTARETYRERTKIRFTGKTTTIRFLELNGIVERWLRELDLGIERAMKFGTIGEGDDGSYGITPTYFSYNITKWDLTGFYNEHGHPFVHAKEMIVSLFPLFLEGPTRMMKISSKTDSSVRFTDAKRIYELVRLSPLRDKELQMYTISASLKGQSLDMGREMAFAPGWLENQSVWLHMSYKFYLELLRHELYDEFFEEMLSGGMLPFMQPDVYGRSPMECSSFIASSAFGDPAIRGRGFLARLSGSTAEYLSIWVLMMIGTNPFSINPHNGRLQLTLKPALPRWLFLEVDEITDSEIIQLGNIPQATALPPGSKALPSLSFKLFGAIDVTYFHNRGDENLFGVTPSRYVILLRDGTEYPVDGPVISGDLADKIRRVIFVASIEAYFDR